MLKCRKETFNSDFMKKHFYDLHKKVFNEDISLERNNGFFLNYFLFFFVLKVKKFSYIF